MDSKTSDLLPQTSDDLERNMYDSIRAYWTDKSKSKSFQSGKDPIYTGLAVYGAPEVEAVMRALVSEKLGLNSVGRELETAFSSYIETAHVSLVNSGSSASLVGFASLIDHYNTSPGEIITTACGFPTTMNPIIQHGYDPVLLDIDDTLNIKPDDILDSITDKTRGIVFAHTLGNPASIREIRKIADDNNLFLLEDCCDAYGGSFDGQKLGTFGDISTYSFYPAHNMTLAGEGGAIATNIPQINKIVRSIRDWGRDCWCDAGEDNRCGARFSRKVGGVDYDHKYMYSRIGYNLKPTEMQAAFGLEQLERLEGFNSQRRENTLDLTEILSEYSERLETIPSHPDADAVMFGFPLLIKDPKIDRNDLVNYLNDKKVATRFLFGGNIIYQPAYKDLDLKVHGTLDKTDEIHEKLFWIGNHPGIDKNQIGYIGDTIDHYLNS
jgi:CDP-6-deoxy-D-xylo-4-hexulose-3-dehydrase